jgi:hypothetical protein
MFVSMVHRHQQVLSSHSGILSWPIHSLFFEVNGCIQSIVAPDEVFFSIYESVFPGCIRGYYYTDATSVSISDIDVAILFKGSSVNPMDKLL